MSKARGKLLWLRILIYGLFFAAVAALPCCEKGRARKGPTAEARGESPEADQAPAVGGPSADIVRGKKAREGEGGAADEEAEERPAALAVELTDANFAELTGGAVVLVDFWAAWCPPCRAQGPIVEMIAKEYAGRATVGKLDVDRNRATSERFGIRSIPTLVIFKNGRELERLAGLQTEDRLRSALDRALGAN